MSGSWQKNHGMRIDHFLVSNSLLNDVKSIKIDKNPYYSKKLSYLRRYWQNTDFLSLLSN